MLGVKFDSYAGESFYIDKIPPIIDELREKGLLVESDGAQLSIFRHTICPGHYSAQRWGYALYDARPCRRPVPA